MAALLILLNALVAAQPTPETSSDYSVAAVASQLPFLAQSEDEKWFWKKTGWGGLGGGFTTIGNGFTTVGNGFTTIGNGAGTNTISVGNSDGNGNVGGSANGGASFGSTIFFTSFFTETLQGPPVTQFLTVPGFTTTIFATQSASVDPNSSTSSQVSAVSVTSNPQQATTITSITIIPTTTTVFQ